ncbi:MAG TPA: hypothetical protein VEV41_06210 [Terriglobales bacterium]|nr:hypothetical protein [Terriglobales bacterium]
MFVNRDEARSHSIRVTFEDWESKRTTSFSGPVAFVTFWKRASRHADLDLRHVEPEYVPKRDNA